MKTGTIRYEARVHGYDVGEQAEVDLDDQQVKDALDGGYAKLLGDEPEAAQGEQTGEAVEQAGEATDEARTEVAGPEVGASPPPRPPVARPARRGDT